MSRFSWIDDRSPNVSTSALVRGAHRVRQALAGSVGAALLLTAPIVLTAPLGCASDDAAKKSASQERDAVVRLKRDIFKVDRSIDVTKRLIARSKGERYLPDLYFRLAELLIEKSRLVYFRILEEAGAEEKGAVVAPEARLLKQQAVAVYKRILTEFPEYEDNDKITFFIAHEYRELGQYEKMIETYEKLVRDYPKSSFRFEAWLILGNHYFDKDDINKSAEYYKRILNNPETYAHNMARYKLGWCYINLDKTKKAVDLWEAAVRTPTVLEEGEAPRLPGESRGRLDVRREALKDLAFYYTEARKAQTALPFFKSITESRDEYRVVLEKLARRFGIKSLYAESAQVYRELLNISHDLERNIDWAQALYENVVASRDLRRADEDVIVLADISRRYQTNWRATDEDKVVLQDFELLTRDLATRLHTQAKDTRSEATYARAARAYDAFLLTFIDSPERLAIEWNYADALFGAKRFVDAGKQYEEILTLLDEDVVSPPSAAGDENAPAGEAKAADGKDAPAKAAKKAAAGKAKSKTSTAVKRLAASAGNGDVKEAMYAAIVAYFEALKTEERGTRLQSMMAREGIKNLGAKFVQLYPDDKNTPQVKFNVARAYYEQGEFDQSAELFAAFVAEYPKHKDAPVAAELALDGFAQLEEFGKLAAMARTFAKNERLADASFRARFTKMAEQAETEEVNRRTIAAEGRVKDVLASFIVEKKGTEIAAKALHQAFVIARDRRNMQDMLDSGLPLLEEYSDTKYAKEVLPSLAQQAMRTLQVEEAAKYYEDYGRKFPQGEAVDELLESAARIRIALGEFGAARGIYERLIQQGAPERRPRYYAELAKTALKAGDYKAAEAAALNVVDEAEYADLGGAIAGEAALRSGDLQTAADRFVEVIEGGGKSEWLGRAQYGLGEVVRSQFEALRFEPGREAEVIGEKFQTLQLLTNAYVGAIQTGEPEWAMGALYRISAASRDAAVFLDGAPSPAGMSPEEEKEYRAALRERAGPLRQQAKETLEACREKARELGAFNRFAEACFKDQEVDETGDVLKSRTPGIVIPNREVLDKRLTDNPKDVDAHIDLARAAISVGDFHLARLVANRGIELSKRNTTLHNLAGVGAARVGDLQAAAFHFRDALKISSKALPARANKATLMFVVGDTTRAVTEANRAQGLEAPPTDVLPQWAAVKKAGGG